MSVADTKVKDVEVAVMADRSVGTVEKVFTPVRSVASGLRLKPPLRFWLGSPAQVTLLRLNATERGIA
jgi:hypothetical protein